MRSEIESFANEVKESVDVLKSYDVDFQHTMTVNIFKSMTGEQKKTISGKDTEDWSEFKAKFR